MGCLIGLNDFAARYGGEEFAVFLRIKAFRRPTLRWRTCGWSYSYGDPYAGGKPITASIGLCDYQRGDGKEMLFRKTDHALYSAKRGGKNAVVTAAVSRDDDPRVSYG